VTPLTHNLVDDLVVELAHLEPEVEVRTEFVAPGLPERLCLGFITDNPLRFMFNFGRTIASDNLDDAIYAAFHDTRVRRAQIGRFQIVYFPDIEIQWSDDE